MKQLLIFCCVLPLFSFAQTVQTSIDNLSGDTTYYTSGKRIRMQWGLYVGEILSVHLSKSKNENLLNVFIITGDYEPRVKKGEELYIKFSDGHIITLHATNDFKSAPIDNYKGWMLSCTYALTDVDIALLKSNAIALVRYQHDGRYRDYEIAGKNGTFLLRSSQLLFK